MRLFIGVMLCVFIAPIFAPYDPLTTHNDAFLQAPNAQYLLGTDMLGRDVLSRLMVGGQRTVAIASLATLIAVSTGLMIGAISGASRGSVDRVLTIVIDALLAIPSLLIALSIIALYKPGFASVVFATGIALVAPYARFTRGIVREVSAQPYVEVAKSLGAKPAWILVYHVLRNAAPMLFAYTGVVFSYSLFNSAALTFLGLGGDLGVPDWGTMLFEGRAAFRTAPWVSFAPGLMLSLLVYVTNRTINALKMRHYPA